ncbi:glycosyl transferase [Leptospira yasudae]|uniref:glycosyltransferase n=1 Tax=Leptospira yasudae TaxID=2202201 RepID=UPI000E59CA1A|nr:glycosyltransferase [Leptospira yasudae]RHX91221.1 glycosyl transferase [Leptospira yasudae]
MVHNKAEILVSVIIPCYNYGEYIDQAVQSVLDQTYKNCEIVIVNDGSDDERTLASFEKYKEREGFIVKSISRSGPSVARNIGIGLANGEFILPLDSDDKIHKDYISDALAVFAKKPSLGIVYCEAEFFGAMHGKWNLPNYRFPDILLDNCIFVSALFRKSDWEEVGGFNENMKNEWEDYDFWLKLIERGRDVYRIPKVLFYYRRGHVSRSSRSIEMFLPLYLQIFENHKQLYLDNIQTLFMRHLQVKELEEEFLILSKIPIVYRFLKVFARFIKFLVFVKKDLFHI